MPDIRRSSGVRLVFYAKQLIGSRRVFESRCWVERVFTGRQASTEAVVYALDVPDAQESPEDLDLAKFCDRGLDVL